MSYTYLLMVLCECAYAFLVSKANFNLINRTDLFICLHIMFQISFQNFKGQKSYCKFLGVRSELLLSIYTSIYIVGSLVWRSITPTENIRAKSSKWSLTHR